MTQVIGQPHSQALPAKKGTFYHVCDVKGKLVTHARSSTSVFKTTTVFFLGKYLVCYLRLCRQKYIHVVVHTELVNFLIESLATTRTITMLAYKSRNFFCQSGVVFNTLRVNYTSLLSGVYLVSTLDMTHMIKCTRLSPFLAGRAWKGGQLQGSYKSIMVHSYLVWLLFGGEGG